MSDRKDLEMPTVRAGATAAPAAARGLDAGAMLGDRYRVLEAIGTGGMGVVYRAYDRSLELDIAIKVLHPDIARAPERLALLRDEVRIARQVTHPNVCRIYDLEQDAGHVFITMEYVAGESLADRLERGPMPLPDAMRVLRDIAAGLAAAHAAGVIHRDLKPANVVLADRAVVADFGIASELASSAADAAGTEGYMAPEQARGAAVDKRADVYAFGKLANELAGSAPALHALIARCLERDPAERPSDGAELARRLEAIATRRPPARWLVDVAAMP